MDAPSARPEPHRGRASLSLARADIGFSAAHFSIIDGTAERLHGHNYRVTLQAHGTMREDGTVIDFHALKDALRTSCARLDERTLLPMSSALLDVRVEPDSVEVRHLERHYLFPRDDVCLLDVVNTTCECLAEHMLREVRGLLGNIPVRLEICVEELPGQGATVEE